ncbi:hypothetical protein JG688_00007615 [Phytophthora aleatoria]|uniref:Uncharacterized protein n=1 Tax=Phytophthora aleatoria TaxID=2496075 RepID=A0A8J5IJE9_9STRA|nr:hypothetical protein JG688_00007615 [Phytophthora aleatoria]
MENRQQEAAEADTRIAEELSQNGLVIKAQIPVGPTHLRLDDHELRVSREKGADFGEFADSLLHAKTLVAEYEQRRLEVSGNMKKVILSPTRRTAASGNGENIGYLDTTLSSIKRTEATLDQHKNHIAGVKIAHAGQRAIAAKASPQKDEVHLNRQDMDETTLMSSPIEQEKKMNPVEKRKNMVILERMQTKLDFVRNPRYAVPDLTNDGKTNVGDDLTESNTSAKPCFDVVPKPPIIFTEYDIGGIYEQVVYVRNTSVLSRCARILPPGELQGPTTSLKSAGGYLSTTDSMRDLLEDATTTHPLVHAPLELQVEFHPRESGRRYRSRFRFNVEHGRDFEVALEGTGHLDEVDNPRDGERPLVRVRELEHSYHIFRGT